MPSMGVSADPMDGYFAGLNPYDQLAVKPAPVANAAMPTTGVHQSAGPGISFTTSAPLWSPDNPLFWFGGLLLATFGLIGLSVAGRVGPAKASASFGDVDK